MKYLALLRGINVGGKNIIKMADLRVSFEKMGFSDISTYIQSGNVIFSTKEKDLEKITHIIETNLKKDFDYKAVVVTITKSQLQEVVESSPKDFGQEPDKYRYDVIFLKPPTTTQEAIIHVETKEGVDQSFTGKHTLYFSRLTSKATQSRLSKIIQKPIYKQMTIRNWNTTTKLLTLMISS